MCIREWTIMIYVAGDNDLDEFADTLVAMFAEAGTSRSVDIVAQLDRHAAGEPSRRIAFTADGPVTIEELAETNTGDWRPLANFVTWSQKNYPARKTMLILWGHGHGISGDVELLLRAATTRGTAEPKAELFSSLRSAFRLYSLDDFDAGMVPVDRLTDVELTIALETARMRSGRGPIDIVCFEACVMNTIEVAYQLRNEVRFVVGTQSEIIESSWRHDEYLPTLFAQPDITPRELAVELLDHFAPDDFPAAASVLDTREIPFVARSLSALGDYLGARIQDDAVRYAVVVARDTSLRFPATDTIDLVDFASRLRDRLSDGQGRMLCDSLIAAVVARLVVGRRRIEFVMERAHGLSLYFPTNAVVPIYRQLDFAREVTWARFLDRFIMMEHSYWDMEGHGASGPHAGGGGSHH